jgi:hypothetical protein
LFPGRSKLFSLLYNVQTGSGTNPVSYTMGTGGCFLMGEVGGSEADHSPPSSAEVKNGGALSSLPIRLHGVVLD